MGRTIHQNACAGEEAGSNISGDRTTDNLISSKSAQCGFSLIELIIVIAIMAILLGLLAPFYFRYVTTKKMTTCQHNREAILRIYERAVYDGSTTILLDNASIAKVVDNSGANYGPTKNEVSQYSHCPLDDKNRVWHAYISDDGSACIVCEKCKAKESEDSRYKGFGTVSIDMLGWSDHTVTPEVDPDREEPTTTEPTTTEPDEEFIVSFNLMGRGAPQPAPQTVKYGEKAVRPTDPSAATYTFGGWYTESGLTTKYTFTESVTDDITLYAKWDGIGSSSIWPYADDPTWWDFSQIAANHSGEYVSTVGSGTRENHQIVLSVPTGIFTSKTGAQYVYIDTNEDGKSPQLMYKDALSPEVYSAKFPQYLIQLTGNKTTYDISNGDKVYPQTYLQNGDLIEFIDGNNVYQYVYFHTGVEDLSVNGVSISAVKSNTHKIGNMYAVNKVQPIPKTS